MIRWDTSVGSRHVSGLAFPGDTVGFPPWRFHADLDRFARTCFGRGRQRETSILNSNCNQDRRLVASNTIV